MEDNTGSRESKKKSMEDNTRSSESKEKRRKSMEDNTRPTENESEEDILDEGDEEADEEHDQEPEVLVQPEPAVNKAPEVSSAPEEETQVYARIVFARQCRCRLTRSPWAGASRTSRSAPSFFRKAGQGTPHKMNKLHVGATISSQSVPGQNIVLVRPRTLGQTNPKEHNGPVPMEGDEEIFEEEAVCKNCFHNLKEENILKTECKCGNALIHEECAAKWSRTRGNNNCDSCGQEVQTFPVTLVRGLSSSTQVVGREESNKSSLFSRLMRKIQFCKLSSYM